MELQPEMATNLWEGWDREQAYGKATIEHLDRLKERGSVQSAQRQCHPVRGPTRLTCEKD